MGLSKIFWGYPGHLLDPLVVPLPSDQWPHLWHMHEAQILLWVGPITATAQKTTPSPSGGPPCPGELDGKRYMNWLKFGSLYTWWDATKAGQHVLHWHMWPCRWLRPTCMCVKQNHTLIIISWIWKLQMSDVRKGMHGDDIFCMVKYEFLLHK